MANNITTMEGLKRNSVRVYPGMIAVYPQFNQEESLDLTELTPKFNGCYASNNSTVCYVDEEGIFVTPYTRSVIDTLRHEGFKSKFFYVSFSNWDYPKSEKEKWEYLRLKAHQAYSEEFTMDCIRYCDEHRIGAISEESLKNCFEMPATGVRVKHPNFEDCYFPRITSGCFDYVAVTNIGRFCTNNGRVVFIYRDGKTYVTKGYKIVDELRTAGYKECGIFVPFSNGEEIVDPVLRARWESITK